MQQVEYYSGAQTPNIERVQGEIVDEASFAVNAKDLYQYNYSNNPYYQQPPQPQYGGYPYPPQGGYYQQNMGGGWNQNAMNPPQEQSGPWSPYFQQMKNNFYQSYYGQPYQPQPQPGYYQQPIQPPPMGEPDTFNLGQMYANPQSGGFSGYAGSPFTSAWNRYQQQHQPYYNQPPNYFQGYNSPFGGYGSTYNNGSYGSPIINAGNGVLMNTSATDVVVEVDGYNPLGCSRGLLRADAEEVCEQMEREMMAEKEKAIIEREKNAKGYFNANMGGYMAYYGAAGATMYNNFIYSTADIEQKYYNKVREMAEEAVQRKRNFLKGLSRMVHSYLGDGTTDEEIDMIYDGYSYTIPAATVQAKQKMERLAAMVPIDTSRQYQEHSAMVSAMFNMCTPPTGNMNDSLHNMGFLKSCLRLEEEAERRRNTGLLYSNDTYQMIIREYGRRKAMENAANGVEGRSEALQKLATDISNSKSRGEAMRNLYGAEKIAEMEKNGMVIKDDGTLSITPPDWFGKGSPPPTGNTYNNVNEDTFDLRRDAFIKSILSS